MISGKIIKTFIGKKGNQIKIREPRLSDLDNVLKFVNDLVKEEALILINQKISRREEERWLKKTIKDIKRGNRIQLIVEVNGKFGGNCEIRRQEKRKKHVGEIGISLAKKYRDEGIGYELLRALIDEGHRLGLRLLTLTCFENNDRAIHVYEKLGFKKAGLVPKALFYQDKYIGEVTMYLELTNGGEKL